MGGPAKRWAAAQLLQMAIQATSHGIYKIFFETPGLPNFPARINRVHLISSSWNSLKPCQASYTTAQQLFDEEYREVISIEKHGTDACG